MSFSEVRGKCNKTVDPSISDFSSIRTSCMVSLADSSYLLSDEAYRRSLSLPTYLLSTPSYECKPNGQCMILQFEFILLFRIFQIWYIRWLFCSSLSQALVQKRSWPARASGRLGHLVEGHRLGLAGWGWPGDLGGACGGRLAGAGPGGPRWGWWGEPPGGAGRAGLAWRPPAEYAEICRNMQENILQYAKPYVQICIICIMFNSHITTYFAYYAYYKCWGKCFCVPLAKFSLFRNVPGKRSEDSLGNSEIVKKWLRPQKSISLSTCTRCITCKI